MGPCSLMKSCSAVERMSMVPAYPIELRLTGPTCSCVLGTPIMYCGVRMRLYEAMLGWSGLRPIFCMMLR